MKVYELKEQLASYLETLEDYDDDLEIRLAPNTYFLGNPRYFLGVAGYDGGYLNLDNLEENIKTGEDDE